MVAVSGVSAYVFRFQSAHFIGTVLSIERFTGPSMDTTHKELWKAVVKVEKVMAHNLYTPVTNLTDEVCIYYDPHYASCVLLTTSRTYSFHCFLYNGYETNRVSLTVLGGSVSNYNMSQPTP
jgi:hypothetical protein